MSFGISTLSHSWLKAYLQTRSTAFSTCGNDDTFGPNVLGCRDDFDFTIKFEDFFFSIAPSAIFIVLLVWRAVAISQRAVIVDAPVLQIAKLSCITVYSAFNLAVLVLTAEHSSTLKDVGAASAALNLTIGFCMIPLSYLEHTRSPRPSLLLSICLFLTIVLDVARVRTSWLASFSQSDQSLAAILTASVAIKCAILILETRHKTKWVKWDNKGHSPEETSGLFSLGVYFWLNSLFVEGYRKVLQIQDLFPLDGALGGHSLQERLFTHLSYSKLKGHRYGLVKILARTFEVPLLLPVPARLALLGFTFCQPFFISSLLDYLSTPESPRSTKFGYGFIGASVLIYCGIGISTAIYWYFHHRMLYMVRGALITAIYRKLTERRLAASDDKASVTLMSTDTERISLSFRHLHEFWANTIEVALASWLLYRQLGVAFVAPIVIVLCCTISLTFLAKHVGPAQRAWMSRVEKRVGMTATVIADMKSIKIAGLAKPMSDTVQKLRVEELESGSKARQLSLASAVIAFVPLMVAPFVTFAVARQSMDAAKLFTSLSYLLLLSNPLTQLFQSIPQVMAGLACLGRIQAFLECDDYQDFRTIDNDAPRDTQLPPVQSDQSEPTGTAAQKDAITVRNGNYGWEESKMVLRDINIAIPRAALTVIVGPIASGKSTLCKSLLGEVPYRSGHIKLTNRLPQVGYCDQTPFLLNGTIKENIIGSASLDHKRYNDVVEATLLDADFESLPQGDGTNVGSNGITLSGGQRQRVSLARALYHQTDLLILDDVFAGLDADTEDKVFRRVFGREGLIRQRRATAVLCTHSVQHLPNADHIIVLGSQGAVIEQGTFEQLIEKDGYVCGLDVKASDRHVGSNYIESETSPREARKREPVHPKPLVSEDNDDKTRQVGDFTVYRHYFKSMGFAAASSMFVLGAFLGFFWNFPTVWLKYWSDDAFSRDPARSYGFYVGIYALLQMCFLIAFGAFGWVLFVVVMKRAGAHLHKGALRTLMHAPLKFFTTTDQGVITNLFSQDLNLVDTELPTAFLALFYSVFVALGQAAVLLTSSAYMAVSYPFLAALMYVVQKFYLRTSRQLRLLDLEAKSPLYTHFLDTTKGILTFRAFGFVEENRRKNIELLNTSQRPAYLLTMIQQWLTLVLNMVVTVMAVMLTALAVQLRSNSGFTGASLVTLMQLGENLSGIVMFYTMLETSIGAVGRLQSFSHKVIPEDQEAEDITLPENWPQKGEIELKSVSASYGGDQNNKPDSTLSNLALRCVSLTIRSGEKVAVCGRTGSGKSSLIALLLKLLEPVSSKERVETAINIDGISLNRINRVSLRSSIIAIPQDAVFLPDGFSFLANLTPSSEGATASDCESTLRLVGLWEFVQDCGGLEAGLIVNMLSHGQRQLLSLARAVLRKRMRERNKPSIPGEGDVQSVGGILLLDEVSSSVDYETERLMMSVIRAEFCGYTIIAVSHRLTMVVDFDTVVVMDKGEIVEAGNPCGLLESERTKFGELWISAGLA